jgi:transcriptional regulator with XRE-family HTH domain
MPTPPQFRAARVLLGLSQAEVAGRACLSVPTIKRCEADRGKVSDAVKAAVRLALEAAGVEFIPENGSGAGVRLRKEKVS